MASADNVTCSVGGVQLAVVKRGSKEHAAIEPQGKMAMCGGRTVFVHSYESGVGGWWTTESTGKVQAEGTGS